MTALPPYRRAAVAALSLLLALRACSKPEPPEKDQPPEPQARPRSGRRTPNCATRIQAPIDRAKAVEAAVLDAAKQQQDARSTRRRRASDPQHCRVDRRDRRRCSSRARLSNPQKQYASAFTGAPRPRLQRARRGSAGHRASAAARARSSACARGSNRAAIAAATRFCAKPVKKRSNGVAGFSM